MRHLYLDIFSGLSGDMLIGSLLDLGVDFKILERELKKLGLDGYHLHAARQQKSALEGVKFDVHLHDKPCEHHEPHAHTHEPDHVHGHGPGHSHSDSHAGRDHSAIQSLISSSELSPWVKTKSLAVFQRIAVAEGKIHGVPPERVQFHEVGAIDSIIDIVGACLGLELLGCPTVTAATVVDGTGFVRCAHGNFPIPTAATLEILGARGIAVTQCEEPHELVTPTGAALLAEFVTQFGPMQAVVGAKVGYGLGTRNHRTRPNVVRAILWDDALTGSTYDWETDTIAVLETNVDDCSGELLGHVLEKALRQGALDAFHTPVHMKKQRPGIILTVLCAVAEADQFSELLLTETSAFGVRRTLTERRKLRRTFVEVKTEFGTIKIKLGHLNGAVIQVAPEFESVKGVAAMAGVPAKTVFEAAQIAAVALQRRLPAAPNEPGTAP